PNRCCRLGANIGQWMAKHQRYKRSTRHHHISHHTEPGRWHMHIHQPHAFTLLIIRWRYDEPIPEPGKDQARRNYAERPKELVTQGHKARRIGKSMKPLCECEV